MILNLLKRKARGHRVDEDHILKHETTDTRNLKTSYFSVSSVFPCFINTKIFSSVSFLVPCFRSTVSLEGCSDGETKYGAFRPYIIRQRQQIATVEIEGINEPERRAQERGSKSQL
jgi:hypothetical protein